MSEALAQRPAPADDPATEVFLGHRELLFSVVYNMLGSVSDTEDVLQETWLAWARHSSKPVRDEIDNPRAYLVRIAVNQALTRQASISRRRETYVGPWLPEPLLTRMSEAQDGPLAAGAADAADSAVRNESVSMALLVVLETLSPLERAVFVLREVFGYSHAEIGEILGRSSSAIRQLAHRAREHVQARRPRFQADPEVRQRVTERFLSAALGGDLAGLMNLLAPDVTLWTDGGGKAPAAMRPVLGRDKVARTLHAYAGNSKQPNLEFHYWHVNGDPSAVVFSGDSPYAVMIVDVNRDSGQVTDVYLVTNPDKLQGVRLDKAGAAGGAPGREPSAPGTGPTRGGHRRAGTDPGAAG